MVQVPTTRPHTRIFWGENSNLLCMARWVLKRYSFEHIISHNYRILHGMAAACGPGGVGGLPLRPLHPRPQRQRPGGLQWGGQEVRTIHHFHRAKSTCHDIFPKFAMDLGGHFNLQTMKSCHALLFSCLPCNLGFHDSPDSNYVRVDCLDVIKTTSLLQYKYW